MARTRHTGSGPWRVTRPAKPPGRMFPSRRDAIMLWLAGGCATVVGTSGYPGPVFVVVMHTCLPGEPEAPQLVWAGTGHHDTLWPGTLTSLPTPGDRSLVNTMFSTYALLDLQGTKPYLGMSGSPRGERGGVYAWPPNQRAAPWATPGRSTPARFPTFQLGRRKARYPAARFLTPPV